jgi:DoxX-like family
MNTPTNSVSKKAIWIGYVLSALPVLLLIMSAVMKFLKPAPVVQGFVHLGYPDSAIVALGVLELACTALYLIPQTTVLGAILLTGYLGGATATTYRVGDTWISTVVLGILLWGGLFLRDSRVRALIPFCR